MDVEVSVGMNWRRTALLVFALAVSFSAGALAASQIEKVDAYIRHDFKILLNGTPVDVGPVLIHDGYSHLPLAAVAGLLDIDVSFDNKTIYLNKRFPGQPDPVGERNVEYDTVTLSYPIVYRAKYLGNQTLVFAIIGKDDGKTYYRDVDLRRLGIDTRALRKAKDTITGEIFVVEQEMLSVAKSKPDFYQEHEQVVLGESDQAKLKAVQNFIDGLGEKFKDPDNSSGYVIKPRVVFAERSGENEYRVLVTANNEYYRYTIKLAQNILEQWYFTEAKAEYLGSPNPRSNAGWSGWHDDSYYPFPW